MADKRKPDQPGCLEDLFDDADLLSDALKDKLREMRDRLQSVEAVKEMIATAEIRAKRDMANVMKSLRELRDMREAGKHW